VGKPGLKKVHRYSVEFKLTAVKLSSHLAYPEVEGNDLSVALSATDLPAVVRRAGRCERRDDAARLYPHIWGFRFGLGFPIRRTPTNSFSPDLALITVELAVFRLG
jgi:hypothetical protein